MYWFRSLCLVSICRYRWYGGQVVLVVAKSDLGGGIDDQCRSFE